MPTGDILRATVEGTFLGEPVMVGFGFVSNSGAADFAADADELATELYAAIGITGSPSPYMSPLCSQYVLTGVRIQDLAPGVMAGRLEGAVGVGGNTTDDALPPNLALCVTWRTGLKGKAYRGRTYFTGFTEDAQNAGYWIEEIQNWAITICNGLMDAFGPVGTGNYSLSLIHTVSGGSRLVPPTATPITSYTVNNKVRSLRRRALGVRISRHRAP